MTDKYIRLKDLYRIVNKYNLRSDIRAKEEIESCAKDIWIAENNKRSEKNDS